MSAEGYVYVRRAYGVDPQVGQRVRHMVTKKLGRIRPVDAGCAHYVQVAFDGQSFPLPCHPTELDYAPAEVTA